MTKRTQACQKTLTAKPRGSIFGRGRVIAPRFPWNGGPFIRRLNHAPFRHTVYQCTMSITFWPWLPLAGAAAERKHIGGQFFPSTTANPKNENDSSVSWLRPLISNRHPDSTCRSVLSAAAGLCGSQGVICKLVTTNAFPSTVIS